MKTGAHWLIWLLLILVVVLFFPKPCGYKSIISENQNQTAQFQESQKQMQNATSEEEVPIEEEPPLVDESFLEGEPLPEENFSVYDTNIDSDLYSEKSWTIKSSEIVTESKCIGFKDYLISRLNKNSSVEWCYGICLEKKEKVNQTETGNKNIPVFLTEILKDFSKLFLILAVVIILIIVLSFIKSVLKKT